MWIGLFQPDILYCKSSAMLFIDQVSIDTLLGLSNKILYSLAPQGASKLK